MTNPTYPLAKFGLTDYQVKNAISSITTANGSGTHAQTFCNLLDLQTGCKTVVPYATYEPNYWLLDGTHHFMPANPTIGAMADALTDSSGNVPGAFVISIFFSSVQSLRYLSLYFDINEGEWASSIEITFWTAGGVNLFSTTVSPTSTIYNLDCGSVITGVDHVNIHPLVTNIHYRFARVTNIDFGQITNLDGTKISDAKITEEFSPITSTLTANSLELDLRLDSSDFSIVNPNATYSNLAQGMPFSVYEVINNVSVFVGLFFLDTWENPSPSSQVVKFNCLDAIGILAKFPFYGLTPGPVYINSTYAIINQLIYIITTLGGVPLTYDATVGAYVDYFVGQPNMQCFLDPNNTKTLRDALQAFAFAFRMGITTWKTGAINLSSNPASKLPAYWLLGLEDYDIALSQEAIEQVSLLPIITSVKINSSQSGFGAGTGSGINATVFSGTLTPGNYIIVPNPQPCGHFRSISGAVATWPTNWGYEGFWFIPITVSTPGTVTVTADYDANNTNAWSSDIYSYSSLLALNPTASIQKSIEINTTYQHPNTTFANDNLNGGSTPDMGQAQWVADYYSGRYVQKSMVYGLMCHAGDLPRIASQEGKYITGYIEESIIHLVGLRCEITVVGVLL